MKKWLDLKARCKNKNKLNDLAYSKKPFPIQESLFQKTRKAYDRSLTGFFSGSFYFKRLWRHDGNAGIADLARFQVVVQRKSDDPLTRLDFHASGSVRSIFDQLA